MELARPRLYTVQSAKVQDALKVLERAGGIPIVGERLSANAKRKIRNSRPTVRKTKPTVTDAKRRARRKAERQSRRVNR